MGQTIQVKILAMNNEKGKISLGLKQTTPEPWSIIDEEFSVGETVKGDPVAWGHVGFLALSRVRRHKYVYVQIIDDDLGHTLASAFSLEKAVREGLKKTCNVEAAKAVGKLAAERARAKGIEAVVFDRGGHEYHGKVKALANAAREASKEIA